MVDFAAARRMMVDCQVRTSDVTDLRLIAAMMEVPRERFVPASKAELAYLDMDLPVTDAGQRCLIKPMVLSKLIQAAGIVETDHVLDVGCATGYSAAVIARLAGSVVALEQDPALAQAARDNLVGARNVMVATGPLVEGWPAGAPYDVILVGGTAEVLPEALSRQLKDNGRLVGVFGRAPVSKAMLYHRRADGEASGRPIFDAAAPPLPGFAEPPAFVF